MIRSLEAPVFSTINFANLSEIPAIIRDYDELQIAEVALIENLQREDLNPIEEALGYKTLMEKFSMTQDKVSERVGKSRSNIANMLRLLSLEDEIKEMIAEGHDFETRCEFCSRTYNITQSDLLESLSIRRGH